MIKYNKEHIDYFHNTERVIVYSDENKKAISITYTFSTPQDLDKLVGLKKSNNKKQSVSKPKIQGKVFKV